MLRPLRLFVFPKRNFGEEMGLPSSLYFRVLLSTQSSNPLRSLNNSTSN